MFTATVWVFTQSKTSVAEALSDNVSEWDLSRDWSIVMKCVGIRTTIPHQKILEFPICTTFICNAVLCGFRAMLSQCLHISNMRPCTRMVHYCLCYISAPAFWCRAFSLNFIFSLLQITPKTLCLFRMIYHFHPVRKEAESFTRVWMFSRILATVSL